MTADPEFAAFRAHLLQTNGVVRSFQLYTSEERADLASSHRLGHRQKKATGEFFYTVPSHLPSVCFPTRAEAVRVAWSVEKVRRLEAIRDRLDALSESVYGIQRDLNHALCQRLGVGI